MGIGRVPQAFVVFGPALALVLASGAGAIEIGCGLDLVGRAVDLVDAEAAPQDVTPPQGPTSDAGDEVPDAEIDAAPPCLPTVVLDDAFETLDKEKWQTTGSDDGYPRIATPSETKKKMLELVRRFDDGQHGAIWTKTPVPTRAFDVSFDYLVACEDIDRFCADGFAVTWVDSTDPATLGNGTDGNGLGLPLKVSGGAASIKLVKNFQRDTSTTPVTLGVHRLGEYPDASATTSDDSLVRSLRRASLKLRNGVLTVTINNGSLVSGATTSGFVGSFGFSGATGANWGAFYIAAFHGEFYACDPN